MIKLVYCFSRKADLSEQEFVDYWKNVHGTIGGRIPGLRRLVQSRAIRISGDQRAPSYDGMAELWFDDVEALLKARESEEWQASTKDEANFIDHSKTAYFVSEEHIVLER